MKSKLFILALLVAIVAGCARSQLDTVSTDQLPTVRYVNFKVYDPVYIAIDRGYFEQRGVNVEIIGDVLAGPNAIQAVSAGSAEAGLSSIPAIINANAAGLPIQGVVDIQTTLKGQSLQRWYVLNDSPIQTIADLPGATYGINIQRSSFHYTSLLMLDENGIDENSVDFRLLSFSDQIPALLNGDIDVAGLIPPYQGYIEQQYGDDVRILWQDFDLYGERHVSLIFVNRVWAQYNPDAAQAFVSGIIDAINWIEQNPDAAAAIVEDYTGIPADAIGAYRFTPNGSVRPADVASWLDYLQQRGDIAADWLDVDAIATNDYVDGYVAIDD